MTALTALWGAVLLVSVVVGVSGTLYKLLGPGGWVGTLFHDGLQAGVLLFCLVAAAAGLFASRASSARIEWRRNALVYLCAGTGLYYLGRLIVRGNL